MEKTARGERTSRLLIVEDDEAQLRTLTSIMEEEGFDVVGCSTASEAIEHIKNLDTGAVVLDLCLPDLSGTQLLERLATTDAVRVIIHTAYGSYETARDSLNLGAFAYVEKAGDPAELLRQVHRASAESLRSYADQLEAEVTERTSKLRQANELLRKEINERKQVEEKLCEYQAKLKAMASEIVLVEDRERHRIATQFHDSVSQKLVHTKLVLESSLNSVSDPNVLTSLRKACAVMGEMIEDAETFTFELSDSILNELGFVAAMDKYLVEKVERKHGIACELESDEQVGALSDKVKTCLFRVTRELLTNVVKHAHANKIKVSVRRSQGQIHVRVEDDGIGFKHTEVSPEVSKTTRFGLFSVREQLEYLGGSLEVESEPGRGTTATVVVPLPEKTVV